MKTTHSFGVHFILRMNKVKNKRAPLYARVVVDGKRVEIVLRKWIELDDWNDERGVARGSRDAARQTNHFIEEVRARLMQFYQGLQLQRQLITAEIIKNKFLGSDQSEHTLCKLIEYHNANMKNSLAWGTQKNYFTTQKYIRLFLRNIRDTSDVYLSQLTYSFITEFEAYLRNYKPLDPVRVPLLPKALEIINKYRGHPRSTETATLFPTISNQKLNSYLKEIADLCGIQKNLTFHLARHTFATTVTLTNGVPIETVSKMLGHSKITTTQVYAKVIEQKVGNDMKALKEKLQMGQ